MKKFLSKKEQKLTKLTILFVNLLFFDSEVYINKFA